MRLFSALVQELRLVYRFLTGSCRLPVTASRMIQRGSHGQPECTRASIPLASLLLPCYAVFISLFSDLNRTISEALRTSEVSVGVCVCTLCAYRCVGSSACGGQRTASAAVHSPVGPHLVF